MAHSDETATQRKSEGGIGRRSFVAGSGAAMLGSLFADSASASASPRTTRSSRVGRKPKNIILLVADGMSLGTLTLADLYSNRLYDRPTVWQQLLASQEARTGFMRTESANSLVTDSAAGATAWAISKKVNNGSINVLPDGGAPKPVMIRASEAGYATGLVTTTRITHATPAAFATIVPSRDMERQIADQYADGPVDVLLGGGAGKFGPEAMGALEASGTTVVRSADALNSAIGTAPTERRLVGLFNSSHMRYEIDRPTSEPSLEAMASASLEYLSAGQRGFFVMIEGGRVDHAAHANDAASLIHDQLAFDRALAACLRWARRRDDTLVVVTTDHGNANPGLTIYGPRSIRGLESIRDARHSFEWIWEQLEAESDRSLRIKRAPDLVRQAVGVELDEAEISTLTRALQGEPMDPFDEACAPTGVLGSILANHNAIGWLSVNHTSDDVIASAIGPGSDQLPRVFDNTELGWMLEQQLGLG